LNTLLTTQHKLHISTHLMTHLVQQHSIYNNNWKIQLYIYIYMSLTETKLYLHQDQSTITQSYITSKSTESSKNMLHFLQQCNNL
jgi:hypothetical protein